MFRFGRLFEPGYYSDTAPRETKTKTNANK